MYSERSPIQTVAYCMDVEWLWLPLAAVPMCHADWRLRESSLAMMPHINFRTLGTRTNMMRIYEDVDKIQCLYTIYKVYLCMCIFNIGAIIIIHVRQLTNAYNIVLNKILYDRNVV